MITSTSIPFQSRARASGRNGFFTPNRAFISRSRNCDEADLAYLEIYSKRPAGLAPIYIKAPVADLRRLARAILDELEKA